MNIENVQKLLDHLIGIRDKTLPSNYAPGFFMGMWFVGGDGKAFADLHAFTSQVPRLNFCGTAACLAGHTQWLLAEEAEEAAMRAEDFAKVALGLSSREAEDWFLGHWYTRRKRLHDLTIEDAIEFIGRKLAEPDRAPRGWDVVDTSVDPN